MTGDSRYRVQRPKSVTDQTRILSKSSCQAGNTFTRQEQGLRRSERLSKQNNILTPEASGKGIRLNPYISSQQHRKSERMKSCKATDYPFLGSISTNLHPVKRRRESEEDSNNSPKRVESTKPAKPTNSWCSNKNNIKAWVAGSTAYLKAPQPPYDFQDRIAVEDFQGSGSVAMSMLRRSSFIEGESKSDTSSSISPDSSQYRKILSTFGCSIETHKPRESKLQKAREILAHPRDLSLILNDAKIEELAEISRENSDVGESELVSTFYNAIMPHLKMQMSELPKFLYRSKDQPWNKAAPISSTIQQGFGQLQFLSTPKPDALFGFDAEQLLDEPALRNGAALFEKGSHSLTREDGQVSNSFLGLEFRSQARKNTRFIAENQQANAGSIRFRDVEKIFLYGYGESLVDRDEPIYFSLAGEGDIATINLHTGEPDANGGTQNISWRLETYVLRRKDEVHALALALLNVITYGSEDLSEFYRELYKECWHKHELIGVFPMKDLRLPLPKPKRSRSTHPILQEPSQSGSESQASQLEPTQSQDPTSPPTPPKSTKRQKGREKTQHH